MVKLLKVPFFIFLTLSMVITAGAQGTSVLITFPQEVEAGGEELYLAEVAVIKGAATEESEQLKMITLGTVPRPGTARWLYRSYVEYVLRRSGWPAGTYKLIMPAKVKIYGASQVVSGETLANAVTSFLHEHAPEEWKEWWFDRVSFPRDLMLPPGEVRITAQGAGEKLLPGLLLIHLKVFLDGKECRTLPVTVRLHVKAEVQTISRDLERFHILSAEDCSSELQELVSGDELLAPPTPGEFRTVRPLRAGTVLKKGDIQAVPEVIKGSRVKITVTSGSIRISTVGLAQEDGWLGDRIRVRNIDSNRLITATVTGPGELEVRL